MGGVPAPGGVCTWSQNGWCVYLVPEWLYLVSEGVPGPGGQGCTWSHGGNLVPRGVYLVPGGVPGPRGGTWSWGGMYLVSGGLYLVPGGVSTWSWGCVYLLPGVCVPGPGGVCTCSLGCVYLVLGVCVPGPEGIYLVPGGTWSWGVPGPRGYLVPGVYLVQGEVPGPGGGVYLVPGGLYLVPGGVCTWSQGLYLVPGGCVPDLGKGGVPGPMQGVPGHRGVCTWSWGLHLVLGGQGCTWSQGAVPGPEGCVYLVLRECTWSWGCTWSQGRYLVLGVCTWFRGGAVPGPRGVCTWSRGLYLVLGEVPGPGGCTWSGLPPVDRNTPVNILPYPKLRLRAVIMHRQFRDKSLIVNHEILVSGRTVTIIIGFFLQMHKISNISNFVFPVSFLIVLYDVSECEPNGIAFEGCRHHWTSSFLMAQLKRRWQYLFEFFRK